MSTSNTNLRRPALAAALLSTLLVLGCTESLAQKDVERPAARPERKPSQEVAIDFGEYEAGKTPPDFTAVLTGGGGPVSWVVQEDTSAPKGNKVLAQTSKDDTNKRYPVAVYNNLTAQDVDVSVQFRPISGEVDQAAGIVWRYQDDGNYYVVRANALENNVVMYKTENGVRSDLKLKGKTSGYGVKAEVPKDKWSILKVSAVGNSFIVYLNDKALFEVVDDTFTGAGKVGLWTKADSVTHFDDLRVTSYDQK